MKRIFACILFLSSSSLLANTSLLCQIHGSNSTLVAEKVLRFSESSADSIKFEPAKGVSITFNVWLQGIGYAFSSEVSHIFYGLLSYSESSKNFGVDHMLYEPTTKEHYSVSCI